MKNFHLNMVVSFFDINLVMLNLQYMSGYFLHFTEQSKK